jgi:hypothetical protein
VRNITAPTITAVAIEIDAVIQSFVRIFIAGR